ncbi:MAG: tetratricopeptide repeat protein [Nitrospira sp.]|nr:tetratricopeptide repeat protein [Nitrospira sp.]
MTINKALQLAVDHHHAGNLQKAVDVCREILKINPNDAEALHLLGVIYYQLGDNDFALKHISESLSLNPSNAEAYYNLGNIFKDRKQLDEAMTWYQKALQVDPNIPQIYLNLGYIFREKEQFDECVTNYRKALQIDPFNAAIYYNLGNVFQDQDKPDASIKYFQKAIQLDPNLLDAYINMGIAFYDKQQLDSAIMIYQEALKFNPNLADAHWNLSHALLLSGNFKEGWKEYEWRWKVKELYQNSLPQTYNFSQEKWDGSDITGLSILLYSEQGFGDTMQFIRYVSLLAQRCSRVIVECPKALTTLLRNVKEIDQIIECGSPRPAFDVHCPLLSLPLVFNTTIETIPAKVPYMFADPALVRKWREKIQNDIATLKIGLVWATDRLPKKKSCSLEIFSSLAQMNDITFYSLQKGKADIQAKYPPVGMKLINYAEEIKDFSDTAALIANLDLIISIDTAVAHLAGAMGKPVWTMLPFAPDWRWMLKREDSPWYPTMKLFRQPFPGDWGSVLSRIETEIGKLLNKTHQF